MKQYKEVKISEFDKDENCWLVDAWETDDDNEEGRVIAKIFLIEDDCSVAKVIEVENGAMCNAQVRDAIKVFIDDLFNEDILLTDNEGTQLIKELYKLAMQKMEG